MNCPICMNPVEQDMREAFVKIREWDGQSYYGEEAHADIYECHCCNCTFYVDWQEKGAAHWAHLPKNA